MASIPWQAGGNLKSLLEILGKSQAAASCASGQITIEDVSQEELEAAAVEYLSNEEKYLLAPIRKTRKRVLGKQSQAVVNDHYPQERQALFQMLLTEAIIDGKQNRIAYIRQLAGWIMTVTAAQIAAEAQVDQAASKEEIRAVQIDFEPIKAADPLVTIKGALSILD